MALSNSPARDLRDLDVTSTSASSCEVETGPLKSCDVLLNIAELFARMLEAVDDIVGTDTKLLVSLGLSVFRRLRLPSSSSGVESSLLRGRALSFLEYVNFCFMISEYSQALSTIVRSRCVMAQETRLEQTVAAFGGRCRGVIMQQVKAEPGFAQSNSKMRVKDCLKRIVSNSLVKERVRLIQSLSE